MNARILNTDATLNSFKYLDSISYSPGESLKVNLQFFNPELDIRYVVDSLTAVVTAKIQKTDSTDLVKVMSPLFSEDRSCWTFSLSTVETLDLGTSNIFITIDTFGDGTDVKIVAARGVLGKVLNGDGDCC